jgi:hypothetical protein
MSRGVGGERLFALELRKERESLAHAASNASPDAIEIAP